MIKKNLFKTVKGLMIAGAVVLGLGIGTGMIKSPVAGTGDALSAGMVTAYAQNYVESNGHSLQLDGDTWRVYYNGNIDYNYDGLALNQYGWWKCSNGAVDFGFNGMACNEYGWFKITNGTVDFGYTGMACNEYGWWYFNNGALDLSYSGMACNDIGWWKYNNGMVDFGYNGLACNEYGWWFMRNGLLDFGYTGMACNEYGWWYASNGALDLGYTGMACNEYGWWYMTNGALDQSFNGVAFNENGAWVYQNGFMGFDYNGTIDYEGATYNVVNSHVEGLKAKKNGMIQEDGNVYYYVNDVMQTGFQNINGNTYYFIPKTGIMSKSVEYIDGKAYVFDTVTGVMYNQLTEMQYIEVGGKEVDKVFWTADELSDIEIAYARGLASAEETEQKLLSFKAPYRGNEILFKDGTRGYNYPAKIILAKCWEETFRTGTQSYGTNRNCVFDGYVTDATERSFAYGIVDKETGMTTVRYICYVSVPTGEYEE